MKKSIKQRKFKEIYFIRANKTKFGGAEVYLSRLSNELDKQNIKHKVVNSIFPKFLPSWLRAILFNLQVCITKSKRFYFSLDRVTCADVYRSGDGVHKVFLKTVNKSRLNPLHPVYLYLEKLCYQNARKIIAISDMVKNDIVNSYNVKPSKISVIRNGINLKEFNYENAFLQLKKEFSLTKDVPIILYVGSGFKRKGVEEFLLIISKLKVDNFKAFVIGKERNVQFYKSLAIELNIEKNVVFTGPRADVDNFYTIGDIFLFPTHYEPFGNVILEAMNFKNVVFTTFQCGGSEVIDKEFVMTHPKDFSVVEKIDSLLLNKDRLRLVQKNNREVSKSFSIEKNLSETLKVIDEVIN